MAFHLGGFEPELEQKSLHLALGVEGCPLRRVMRILLFVIFSLQKRVLQAEILLEFFLANFPLKTLDIEAVALSAAELRGIDLLPEQIEKNCADEKIARFTTNL